MKQGKSLFLFWLLFSSCGAGVSDYSKSLGDGYCFASCNSHDKTIYGEQGTLIGPTVIGYSADNKHIVAIQRPYEYQYSAEATVDYTIDTLSYWVLDKATKDLYGPMSQASFLAITAKLKVENKLIENLFSSREWYCLRHTEVIY